MSEAMEAYRYARRYKRKAVLILSIDSHGNTYAATYAADPPVAETVDEMTSLIMGEDAIASEQCKRIKEDLLG